MRGFSLRRVGSWRRGSARPGAALGGWRLEEGQECTLSGKPVLLPRLTSSHHPTTAPALATSCTGHTPSTAMPCSCHASLLGRPPLCPSRSCPTPSRKPGCPVCSSELCAFTAHPREPYSLPDLDSQGPSIALCPPVQGAQSRTSVCSTPPAPHSVSWQPWNPGRLQDRTASSWAGDTLMSKARGSPEQSGQGRCLPVPQSSIQRAADCTTSQSMTWTPGRSLWATHLACSPPLPGGSGVNGFFHSGSLSWLSSGTERACTH